MKTLNLIKLNIKTQKHINPFLTLLIILTMSSILKPITALSVDMSVQPLYLEFEKKKAAVDNFQIRVEVDQPTKLKASLYRAIQKNDGYLDFHQVTDEEYKNIVKIDQNLKTFNRGGVWNLTGQIKYPKNISKTEAFVIMIEEVPKENVKGIEISVRYAVVLRMKSTQKRILETANINFKNITHTNKGFSINANILNTSIADFKAKTVAVIRNQNNQLIEKITLNSASSWQKESDSSIIFPKTKVLLTGKSSKIKQPGLYKVQIISQLNDKRQISHTNTFTVESSAFIKSESSKNESQKLTYLPQNLDIITKEKGASLFRFQITNPTNSVQSVELPIDKKNNSYVFMPNKVKILPGSSKTLIIKINPSTNLNSLKNLPIKAIIKDPNDKKQMLLLPFKVLEPQTQNSKGSKHAIL